MELCSFENDPKFMQRIFEEIRKNVALNGGRIEPEHKKREL